MLDIVIYERNNNRMLKNIDAINIALANYDIDYRIHKFKNYSNKLKDTIKNKNLKKIYIINIEIDDSSGLDIASNIREDDFESIIIFTSLCDKYHNDVFYKRLMVLDFICKNNKYTDRLKDDINMALKIIYKNSSFIFKYNHTVYRIPYTHINYIEKEPLIKRCIIHTINNNYYIVSSIENLNRELGTHFLRTHQSCIINTDNVKSINCCNNEIVFNNDDSTVLLTEKMKKVLKEHVNNKY